MSYITEVIIVGQSCHDKIKDINKFLIRYGHKSIEKIDKYCGGEKYITDVLAGGFNYLNRDKFIDFLTSLSWGYPTELFIKSENNTWFEQIVLGGEY